MQRHNFYFDEEEGRWMPERTTDYWDWRLENKSFMPSTISKSQYLEANAMPVRSSTKTEEIYGVTPSHVISCS